MIPNAVPKSTRLVLLFQCAGESVTKLFGDFKKRQLLQEKGSTLIIKNRERGSKKQRGKFLELQYPFRSFSPFKSVFVMSVTQFCDGRHSIQFKDKQE